MISLKREDSLTEEKSDFMKKVSDYADVVDACEISISELKKMLKRKNIPVLTKNSIKYLIPVGESTKNKVNSRKGSLENALIVLRGVIGTGYVSQKSLQTLDSYKTAFESELKEINRDTRIDNISLLLDSGDRNKIKQGLKEIADYAVEGYKEAMAPFIFTAINLISDEDPEIRKNAAKFIFYASSYKESIFNENRSEILKGLKNVDPDVRAIISLTCAKIKDTESIEPLVNLQTDHSMSDIGILSIPDYMLKFPHSGTKARLNDIVTDSIYEIVNSKRDTSLYLTMSIRKEIKNNSVMGGLSLSIEIVPIVDLPNLVIDFTNLKGSFDIIGETNLSFDLLKAGEIKLIDTGMIPEKTGHLRGYINCTTSNGWKASMLVEVVVEEEKEKSSLETSPSQENVSQPSDKSKESMGSTALDILVSDIESGRTSKVVNALEELTRYVSNDKSLSDRISALAITISLRGVEKVSKSEMETAIDLVKNVKRRIT